MFFCDSHLLEGFPNHPQPRTFSAVSEPPRLKQLDTAMMYLCHAADGSFAATLTSLDEILLVS